MANIDKTFLDLPGLQSYDEKIKNYVQEALTSAMIPTFSENSILFDFISNDNDNNNEGG